MQFCTYCGQSFTRNEHLERHILTHTNVKPYKCSHCHMSFSRRDLLRKHHTSHVDSSRPDSAVPLPGGPQFPSTSRALVACSNCVKRKTKCDNGFPCARCAIRRLACNQRAFQRSRGESAAANSKDTQENSNEQVNVPDHISSPAKSIRSPSSMQSAARNSNGAKYHSVAHSENGGADEDRVLAGTLMHTPEASDRGVAEVQPSLSPYHSDGRLDLTAPGYLNVLDLAPSLLMDWSEFPANMTQMASQIDADGFISSGNFHDYAQEDMMLPLFNDENVDNISDSIFHDHPNVIIGRDFWNNFKCNPLKPVGGCPKTAGIFLRSLEDGSDEENSILAPWDAEIPEHSQSPRTKTTFPRILESTRDKLLAVSQGFLLKAHEIHSLDERDQYAETLTVRADKSIGILRLPSTKRLEKHLQSFLRNFDTFYSTFPGGTVDANSLIMLSNNKTSGLLLLLAIAQGAATELSKDGLRLSGGLTEMCRISLFDIIEKDILLARDQLVLQSALIFTIQACWSGDKWQMDIGAGQRGIYIAMLRHGGIFEPLAMPLTIVPCITSLEHAWDVWQLHESRVRLLYSWVISDQELSLFSDRAPLISITELNAAIPNADELWNAKTALIWQQILKQNNDFYLTNLPEVALPKQMPSLCEVFSNFLNDEITPDDTSISATMLRLLLYPIQGLVSHLRQLLTCFRNRHTNLKTYRSVSKTSLQLRLEEVQSLLYRWHHLWQATIQPETAWSPVSQATLIMYHLISLDTITSFSLIEKLAREHPQPMNMKQSLASTALIEDPRQSIIHSGQVLRLVSSMPRDSRPPWWAAAIYRVALILWAQAFEVNSAISIPSQGTQLEIRGEDQASDFRIDSLHEGHEILQRFERFGEGRPTLANEDGEACPLTDPKRVLQMCVLFIKAGVPTRFTEGIKAKLRQLSEATPVH